MCGIVGVLQRTSPVDREILSNMTHALRSRGPDDGGLWVAERAGLGHRRLSIIDVSPAGRQPMWNENQTLGIVFNGEIYNYGELRQRLHAHHVFSSRTDTEVLLHLFEERGPEVCSELEGMFAFAIYDTVHRQLTCARDRFGEKPLHYVLTDELFAFASEPKSLFLHPTLRPLLHLDGSALAKYLCYGFVPSPHCLVAPVQKLEPATVLEFDADRWEITRHEPYWDLPCSDSRGHPEREELIADINEKIRTSVSDRLRSDVPVGIFLSGGLDSSIVAANVVRAGRQLTAFTVSADDPAIDEAPRAAAVAHHLGIPHRVIRFTTQDLRETWLAMLDYLDEPLADAALFPTAFLARAARQDVTVVVSGEGGDELFGGYLKYRAQLVAERTPTLARRLGSTRWGVQTATRIFPHAGRFLSALSFPFPARQYLWGSGSPSLQDVAHLLGIERLDPTEVFEDAYRYYRRAGDRDPVQTALYLDAKLLLPDGYNMKTDRATMSASLELRSPFLDTSLAEAATRLPVSLKVSPTASKILLKQVAAHLLPPVVLGKKLGFGVPLARWMRHEVRDLVGDALAEPALAELVNREMVERLWNEHQAGARSHEFLLLRLGVLGGVLRHTPARLR